MASRVETKDITEITDFVADPPPPHESGGGTPALPSIGDAIDRAPEQLPAGVTWRHRDWAVTEDGFDSLITGGHGGRLDTSSKPNGCSRCGAERPASRTGRCRSPERPGSKTRTPCSRRSARRSRFTT